MSLLQCDILYGGKYLYGGRSPHTAADMVPISISGVSHRKDVWYIAGENFTAYCEVTVDGELLKPVYLPPWLLWVPEDLVISVVDKHHEILSDTE